MTRARNIVNSAPGKYDGLSANKMDVLRSYATTENQSTNDIHHPRMACTAIQWRCPVLSAPPFPARVT